MAEKLHRTHAHHEAESSTSQIETPLVAPYAEYETAREPAIDFDPRLISNFPGEARERHIVSLQQTIGNRAVQRSLTRGFAQAKKSAGPVDDLAQRIRAASSGGESLDGEVQRQLGAGLGADLSAVRVHTDAEANHLARSVESVAFTTGQDIFFRSGAYAPSSPQGLHLLAHEAAHTVQQSAGPVAGASAPGGVSISDPSDSFEQAAEQAANRVLSGAAPTAPRVAAGTYVQRQAIPDEEEEPIQTRRADASTMTVQREELPDEEEEMVQPRRTDAPMTSIQREALPEEEEMVQTRRADISTMTVQREALPEEEEMVQTRRADASTVAVQREALPEEEEEMVQTCRADTSTMSVQREELPEEEEEMVQTRRADASTATVQREELPKEEEMPMPELQLQRSPPDTPVVSPAVRQRRERAAALGAADARQMLSAQLPAVLGVLTETQIEQAQRVFDAKVINPEVKTETRRLQADAYILPGGGEPLSIPIASKQAKADAAWSEMVPVNEADRRIRLNATSLLDSDVMTPPNVNVMDEMAFRDWMYQRLESSGVWLRVGEEFQPHGLPSKSVIWLSLGPDGDAIPTPNGMLNMKALLDTTAIGARYYEMVWRGPQRMATKKLSDQLFAEMQAGRQEHFEAGQRRDDAWFFVRWQTESFGGADYPSISIWDEVYALYFKALDLDVKGHIEEAYKGYIDAARAFERAAKLLNEFESRKQSRLESAVKWLGRAKIAGAIAATIATGGLAAEAGLGLAATGTAMAEGAALYGGFQEGAQQMSEMGHGQRESPDLTAIGSRMVKEYVFGRVGASVGLRTSNWIAQGLGVSGRTGLSRVLGGILTQAGGSALASPVMTTLELAGRVITGDELPEGPGAMAWLYLERAAQAAVAGGFLGGVMSSPSAVKAQEASRISELISERQTAFLGRVNKSAVKAWNEGGSWAVDEAAVRTLARDTANRLRRGALPDGTRARLPRADLRSAADKLEKSIENQIEAAHNLTKVPKGPQGTVDQGPKANREVTGWHKWQ